MYIPLHYISNDSKRGRSNTKLLDEGVKSFDLHTKKANKTEYTNKIKETVKYMKGVK